MPLDRFLRLQVPRRLLEEVATVCGAVVVRDAHDNVRQTFGEGAHCLTDGGRSRPASGRCLPRAGRGDGWFACVEGAGEHRVLALLPAAAPIGWLITGLLD